MKKKFKVGDEVAIDRDGLPGGGKFTIARVMKSFVEINTGGKFTHSGRPYPARRRGYSTSILVPWGPENERIFIRGQIGRKVAHLGRYIECNIKLDIFTLRDEIVKLICLFNDYDKQGSD